MGKLAAALVLVVFAVGAATWFVPWLIDQRPVIASTPSLSALYSRGDVKVPARQQACIRPVPLDPAVREVQMVLHTTGTRAPAVNVTLFGPGYRATGRFADYAVGGATPVVTRLSQAPPRATEGQLCLRNTSRRAIYLVGTNEPTSVTLPVTYVGQRAAGEVDPAVTFLSGEDRSLLQRANTILHRAAAFTGVIPGALTWPLAILFITIIPLGAAAALLLATRTR
jgi:hypothetical protein